MSHETDLEHLLEGARQRVARLMSEARFLEERLNITNPVPVQRQGPPTPSRHEALSSSAPQTLRFRDSPLLSSRQVPSRRGTTRNCLTSNTTSRTRTAPKQSTASFKSSLDLWNPNFEVVLPLRGKSASRSAANCSKGGNNAPIILEPKADAIINSSDPSSSPSLSFIEAAATRISSLPSPSSNTTVPSTSPGTLAKKGNNNSPKMSFIPRPKIVHSSPLTPSTNAASACTSRPSLKERLHEPITPNSIILPESLDTPTTGNLTQGSLSSATTRFTPTSIQDADQIIADFLNINGHSNTASNQQLGFRPASRPNSQTAPRNSGTRAPGSRPGRILRSTTNSTGTARTQREPTSTAEVPNPSSSLLSRRMNQNSVDGLLSRLQQSSLDEYDAGLVAPLPVPYPRYSISLDTSLGSEADAVEEEEDGEEWYRHVFGDFRDAGIDDRMTRFAGLDDETPVQRLLRRYNEGAEGVDSDMLRRFVTTEADELGDAPNGHGSDGRFSEARSRTLNPLSNTSGVFGGGTNESLTQILLRLSDASAALTNGFNFEVDTSDEEYLSEGERVASLAMLESLIEMGDNGLRSTISAVGATDTEMNKIPVRILGSLVSKSGSGMDVSCCPICLVDFEMGGTVLEYPGCEHCFHRECLFKWLNVSRKCPSCRRELSV